MEKTLQDTQKVVKKTRFMVKAKKEQYKKPVPSASKTSSGIDFSHQLEIIKSIGLSPLYSTNSSTIGGFSYAHIHGE